MLSIIIIGKNEGWKLSLCLTKVFETIKYNELSDYEVIYVDSKSTDDSIERAKQFDKVKIVELTGDCNAAIARNVGVEVSKGDVLFFLDGDMELIPEAFGIFYSEVKGIEHPFLSGNFENIYYNQEWILMKKSLAFLFAEDIFCNMVGGLFFIERGLWEQYNGMRNVFKRSQDFDLSLRLAHKGLKLLRKKDVLVRHHMISYMDRKRKWHLMFNGADVYGRSLLYRRHFFERQIYKMILFREYSLISFLAAITFSLFFGNFCFLLIYPLVLFVKTVRKKELTMNDFLYYFVRDLITAVGFLFFYPNDNVSVSYKIC